MTYLLPPPVFAGPRASYNHLPRWRFARGGGGAVTRIGTILLLLPLLAGCGFRAMYGDSRLEPQLQSIYVEPVAERDGYELRNSLIDLLGSDGQSGGKAYRLRITVNEANRGVVLQNDTTISRYNDTMTVNYTLTDAKGTEITHGTQSSLSSYSVAPSPYATLAAQQDSDKRAVDDIANRIRIDLGAFFRRRDSR
jgi:LPS-assembly lipoprotein